MATLQIPVVPHLARRSQLRVLSACHVCARAAILPLPMSDVPLPFPPSRKEAASSEAERQSRAEADREMMHCFTSGDETGFATFYRRFAPGLFSLVYRILQDPKESEDVLQEAFVQMWKNTATYDPSRSSLFTWAVMISRNKAIDRLRARQRRFRVVEAAIAEAEVTPAAGAGPADEALGQSDERLRVRAALETLPMPQREAIDLAFFGGMTQAEISTKLGTPLGTVKARIRRGLLALREVLPRISA